MDVVVTRGLTKTFGETRAVEGLDLAIAEGEIFGLVGPDGAGKTTTLRMLASIMDPSSGDAFILGRHTVREAAAVKDQIAYMSQRFGLYPDLTVLENLVFYADLYGVSRRERDAQIDRLLAFSNMAPFRKRRAGNLSGGMKQKLGLACALIHAPKVLLLDEPTNGVDPVSRREFWRILYHLLKEGVTIVVSTAYLEEAERCSRVAFLHEGKLAAVDTPAALHRLLPGRVLEVRTNETRGTAERLRDSLGAANVMVFGDRVDVSPAAKSSADSIRELLGHENIEVESIDSVEPKLENVFVALLSGGTP